MRLLILTLLLSSCSHTIEQDGHLYNREVMPDGVEIVYHSDECGCTTKLDCMQFEFE